jgi:hypothetical protein
VYRLPLGSNTGLEPPPFNPVTLSFTLIHTLSLILTHSLPAYLLELRQLHLLDAGRQLDLLDLGVRSVRGVMSERVRK